MLFLYPMLKYLRGNVMDFKDKRDGKMNLCAGVWGAFWVSALDSGGLRELC